MKQDKMSFGVGMNTLTEKLTQGDKTKEAFGLYIGKGGVVDDVLVVDESYASQERGVDEITQKVTEQGKQVLGFVRYKPGQEAPESEQESSFGSDLAVRLGSGVNCLTVDADGDVVGVGLFSADPSVKLDSIIQRYGAVKAGVEEFLEEAKAHCDEMKKRF